MSVPNPSTISWVPIQGKQELAAYWGTYESSRIYNDGDCVIDSNGILYLCTKNGTTTAPIDWPKRVGPEGAIGPQGLQGIGMPVPVVNGRWLKGIDGAAVWSSLTVTDIPNARAKPTYGVDLPPGPIDGQEHILVDSINSPTWSWRCRYNGSSVGAYKWDVEGIPLFAYVNGQYQIPAGGWQALSSTTIRVPRSGAYICECSCRLLTNVTGNYGHFNISRNGAANPIGPMPVYTSDSGLWTTMYTTPFQYFFSAGDLLGTTGAVSALPAYYDMQAWSIRPVRIS